MADTPDIKKLGLKKLLEDNNVEKFLDVLETQESNKTKQELNDLIKPFSMLGDIIANHSKGVMAKELLSSLEPSLKNLQDEMVKAVDEEISKLEAEVNATIDAKDNRARQEAINNLEVAVSEAEQRITSQLSAQLRDYLPTLAEDAKLTEDEIQSIVDDASLAVESQMDLIIGDYLKETKLKPDQIEGLKDFIESQIPEVDFSQAAIDWRQIRNVPNLGGGGAGARTLYWLNDVDISTTAPTNGQALVYNSTTQKWSPGNVDSLPTQTGNNGKYLTTDGSTASWATLAGGGDMAAATYDAAGVAEQLAGLTAAQTLTNKTINADNNTITNLAIGAEVAGNVSDLTDVTITTIASGELLKWNGSAWINNTLAEAGIAAASHTHTAADVTDFDTEVANNSAVAANTAKVGVTTQISNVVEDTTPQLGGSLDVNGNKIVSVSNGNIDIEPNGTGNVLLGNFTFDADQTVGAGQDNYVLTYDNATGLISLEAATGGSGDNVSIDGVGVTDPDFVSTGDIDFVDTSNTITANINSGAVDIAHLSATGTPSSSTYLRGDNTWATPAGSGDVSKVGTPVNNQIGVWTGDGTIEGDASFTWTGAAFRIGDTSGWGTAPSQTASLNIASGSFGQINITRAQAVAASGPAVVGYRAMGTEGTPTAATTDAELMQFSGRGYDGTSWSGSQGEFSVYAAENWNGSAHGTYIKASVTPTGSTTETEIFRLTGDGLNMAASSDIQFNGTAILSDSAGTMTLSNIDALDATTEATIEAAIDTLANLTSVQGRTVTLADAGADAIFGWDDSANAYENLTAAEVRTIINVEDGADVTDATNVTAAGALMDSELTDIVAVKALSDADVSATNTGTSTTAFVTPDGLAGSYAGTKSIGIQVTDGSGAIATGDGKAYFRIPSALNGMDLVSVAASLTAPSTSGLPNIMIARGRQAAAGTAHAFVDMLSTAITIDANEYDSKDATTAAVINTSNDDVATGDLIRVDVDGVGSGPTAVLSVNLEFRLP